jgi:hypothetical protein
VANVPTRDGRAGEGAAKNKLTIPEFLPNIINCKPEEDPHIKALAAKEKVALMAFIAPRVSVRISPVEEASASIGLLDEFGVEALVNRLKEAKVKKAYLLVNSPGGAMSSSYKIARAISASVESVTTFVPHIAASGGTLLALVGNEIVMGPMSHITPLDVQTIYKNERVSAASAMRFFERATRWFEKSTPEEAPYPQRALTDKLDPYLMEEWNGVMTAMMGYVMRVLARTGYDEAKAREIANRIVTAYPTHSYVIDLDEAQRMGLNAKDSAEWPETWDLMRHWLGKYLAEPEMTHCIRFVLPEGGKGDNRVTTSARKPARMKATPRRKAAAKRR